MRHTIYLPIFRGSIKVEYENNIIYRVEYIDEFRHVSSDDIVYQLFKRYVDGLKTDFTKLKIDLNRLTTFQRNVYQLIREVPYGEVRSYKWVANQLGIKSPRAIGQALKRNPYIIIVPCHRIIKSNGSIGGYTSIHGVELKRFLLDLEGVKIY